MRSGTYFKVFSSSFCWRFSTQEQLISTALSLLLSLSTILASSLLAGPDVCLVSIYLNIPESRHVIVFSHRFWLCGRIPRRKRLSAYDLSSKYRILSAASFLSRYLVSAGARQLDNTCARLSCAFPHNLHLSLWSLLVLVILILYNFVGRSC